MFAGLALAIVIGVLSWTSIHRNHQATLEARRTVRVMTQVGVVLRLLIDAETGQRGYLITGRKPYLAPYAAAVKELPAETASLRAFAAELPEEQEINRRIDRIEQIVANKLRELKETIAMYDRGETARAIELVDTDEGLRSMDELRAAVISLRKDVADRWEVRLKAVDSTSMLATICITGSVGALVLFLLLLGRWLLTSVYRNQRDELALRDAEARYRTTLASVADGLLATDAAGRVQFINSVAEALTGVNREDALGRPVQEVFSVRDDATGQPIPNPVTRVLTLGNTQIKPLLALIGTAPGFKHVEYSASPITDADGHTTGAVLVFRDVIERLSIERERDALLASERAARSEAERSSRLKDEFVATLSHELRTPLNAILGWTQILRRPGVDAFSTSQGLEIIERNTRVQTALVTDLLDMSRMMSGKLRLDVQPIDLPSIVRESVESSRPTADNKGVKLLAVIDANAGPVTGDPARLQQVLWNLLSNALKFTPKGGTVSVRLRKAESSVVLEVEDNGEGISSDFLPHVFERFRQADATTTRRHGGLGLGLSIARQLVELHGGRIEADSRGLGLGSRFTVRLPMIAVQQRRTSDGVVRPLSRAGDDSSIESPSLSGINVIVVDDEPDARTLLQVVLRDRGATVRAADSVAHAFELLGQHVPDIIISDLGMPVQDGFQLVRKLRSLSEDDGGRIPAIALTAFASTEDRTRSLVAGFQAHLTKPVEAAELIATVASLNRNDSPGASMEPADTSSPAPASNDADALAHLRADVRVVAHDACNAIGVLWLHLAMIERKAGADLDPVAREAIDGLKEETRTIVKLMRQLSEQARH